MDSNEDSIHVIIRLPFARPEGYVDTQPVVWTESMEKTLWQLIGQTKPSLVDWNAVSRQLGNVPVPFLIRHATQLYQTQLQDLHRIGEQQQELTALSRPSSRSIVGTSNSQEGTIGYLASSRTLPTAKENEPLSSGSSLLRDRDLRIVASGSTTVHGQDSASKAQASPSLSGSITSFPVSGKPASMSSSASTIRPANPSSPAPSLRSTPSSQQQTSVDVNPYSSGIMASRGPTQPRSTRSSQLIGSVLERRPNPAIAPPNLPTSPRDDISPSEILRRISEPSHPFHKATLSAAMQQSISGMPSAKQSPSLRTTEFGHTPNTPSFQDNDRSSTLSSVSTPYSQSNSASQIFEETSFFNQLSSNDSLTRGQRASRLNRDELSSRGAFATSPVGDERSASGGYGLGLIGSTSKGLLSMDHHRPEHIVDLDDESEGHTENEDDDASQDESGPLREQIKQLHLEDALAFLPIGSTSGSSMIQRSDQDSYQSRTAAGDRMPFQLDDELASLGTRALEEIHENDGGDEDDHLVKGIRFKDIMGPGRLRGFSRDGKSIHRDHTMRTIRTSPERSGLSSRKSSAQNSVGSSFSDLSDSSVTRSALEDAYLSGYNNSKTYG
ncbi:hypothetical protein BGW38_003471 [Lunasporangiospora selenospora]|uniref:Autophagy-related protein 29 n=1 Tax=Lunasporangiospora selenospora TaxID=979761 RepID=A0A9P6FQK4_9FUNG|nr:hypothetical protein BGW38_003471 [Lunasporangiospora selenospora]